MPLKDVVRVRARYAACLRAILLMPRRSEWRACCQLRACFPISPLPKARCERHAAGEREAGGACSARFAKMLADARAALLGE